MGPAPHSCVEVVRGWRARQRWSTKRWNDLRPAVAQQPHAARVAWPPIRTPWQRHHYLGDMHDVPSVNPLSASVLHTLSGW
jgi:hypothetical protein